MSGLVRGDAAHIFLRRRAQDVDDEHDLLLIVLPYTTPRARERERENEQDVVVLVVALTSFRIRASALLLRVLGACS